MKQLGLAFIQYTQDYDERYPFAGNWQHWADGGHWVAGVNGTGPSGAGGALCAFTAPYAPTGAKARKFMCALRAVTGKRPDFLTA